ncbi:Csu type fimbrial protein [Halomonas sp. LS-001]
MMMVMGAAQAAPSDTFTVSATITPGCLINNSLPAEGVQLGTLGSLAFGTASALSQETRSAALAISGAFTLSCTPDVALNMRVDGGRQPIAERRLKREDGSETLAYQLYQDAAFQDAIGINQPVSVNTTYDPDDISLPIWGQVTLPGDLPAGIYTDELVLTLEW